MRSTASRVSASDAGGSGLTMMIQPASGPGRLRAREVQDLPEALRRDQADARALGLEHGVRRDGRAVDDVARGRRARCRPRRRCARRRSSTPSRRVARRRRRLHAPLAVRRSSSTRNRSVNVPPTSTPSRYAMLALLLVVDHAVVRAGASRSLRARTPSSSSTASVSAPTVQRAAWRIAPGVPLSFGTTPGHGHRAVHLVLVLDEQPALAEVRVLVDVLRPCRPARTRRPPSLTIRSSSSAVCRAGQRADDLVEQVLVLAARVVGGEALVLAQLGLAHELRQPPPQRVVVGGDHDPLAVAWTR